MKKILSTMVLLAGAVSAYSQGWVSHGCWWQLLDRWRLHLHICADGLAEHWSQGGGDDIGSSVGGRYTWGVSEMVTTTLATGGEPPGNLPFGPTGLTDFSLVAVIPEPSTIALGVMGTSALLLRRRK